MDKNFRVGQSNELICNELIYDLHNCYDFSGFQFLGNQNGIMLFSANSEHGKGCSDIVIEFSKIDCLVVNFKSLANNICDLDEIGYKRAGDYNDEWLLPESAAGVDDHLFFRFFDYQWMRLHSAKAELRHAPAHKPTDR